MYKSQKKHEMDVLAYFNIPGKKIIKYITTPDPLGAVRKSPEIIALLKDPSLEVQLEAVKQNGYNISYIENPSKAVQLEAIKNCEYDPNIFYYCPDFEIEDFKDEILLKGLLT